MSYRVLVEKIRVKDKMQTTLKPWSERSLAPASSWAVPENVEKRKRMAFDLCLCSLLEQNFWSGGGKKYEHEETILPSVPCGYHSHLTVGGGCFLHLSIEEKIIPNPYPKIYICRVLHGDKVVSPQSTPLRWEIWEAWVRPSDEWVAKQSSRGSGLIKELL